MVFGEFWSENAYILCPFWSGIGYGFRGNYGSPYGVSDRKNKERKQKKSGELLFADYLTINE